MEVSIRGPVESFDAVNPPSDWLTFPRYLSLAGRKARLTLFARFRMRLGGNGARLRRSCTRSLFVVESIFEDAIHLQPVPSCAQCFLIFSRMAPVDAVEDVVIIGSGPAAHTAAIYLGRAELKPVLFEGFLAAGVAAGGQVSSTYPWESDG